MSFEKLSLENYNLDCAELSAPVSFSSRRSGEPLRPVGTLYCVRRSGFRHLRHRGSMCRAGYGTDTKSVIQVSFIVVFLFVSFACHFDFLESRLCDIYFLTTKVYERSMGLSLLGTAQLHEKFPVSGIKKKVRLIVFQRSLLSCCLDRYIFLS